MLSSRSFSSSVAQTFLSVLLQCCIIALFFLVACSRWSNDDETFVRTYTEIIIIREQYPDTALANTKVAAILRQNGFTEASFRQRFRDLAEKPERLRQILDTARNRARRIGEDEQKKEQKAEEKNERKNERQQQLK